jgi:ribosomal protein RSM22 (predicted rRNA methylase)
MSQRRASCVRAIDSTPIRFTWRIDGISHMAEAQYTFSPAFYLDGYWFRLQAGRIRLPKADAYTFALFLSLVIENRHEIPIYIYIYKLYQICELYRICQ